MPRSGIVFLFDVDNQPEVMIANAAGKFDEHGNLKDPTTSEKIEELLEALVDWTRRLKKTKA